MVLSKRASGFVRFSDLRPRDPADFSPVMRTCPKETRKKRKISKKAAPAMKN